MLPSLHPSFAPFELDTHDPQDATNHQKLPGWIDLQAMIAARSVSREMAYRLEHASQNAGSKEPFNRALAVSFVNEVVMNARFIPPAERGGTGGDILPVPLVVRRRQETGGDHRRGGIDGVLRDVSQVPVLKGIREIRSSRR